MEVFDEVLKECSTWDSTYRANGMSHEKFVDIPQCHKQTNRIDPLG